MTDSEYKAYLQSDKWAEICEQRRRIDRYRCCACGCAGTQVNPLEVHHLSYKHIGNEETRIYEDLVTLCHSCHKLIHRAMERTTSPDGRRGWLDNARIPQVHVFTNSGEDRDFIIGQIKKENGG